MKKALSVFVVLLVVGCATAAGTLRQQIYEVAANFNAAQQVAVAIVENPDTPATVKDAVIGAEQTARAVVLDMIETAQRPDASLHELEVGLGAAQGGLAQLQRVLAAGDQP